MASYTIDIGNTTQYTPTISAVTGVDSSPSSGVIVGRVVDLLHANAFCNVQVVGGPSSGVFRVQVQTSDTTTSGTFTDPTSGLAQMPTSFASGGVMFVNSGLWASGTFGRSMGGTVDQAPLFCSGGVAYAAFQRPHRYARALVMSGNQFDAPVSVAFVTQLKSPGSGAGFTFSPAGGSAGDVINV